MVTFAASACFVRRIRSAVGAGRHCPEGHFLPVDGDGGLVGAFVPSPRHGCSHAGGAGGSPTRSCVLTFTPRSRSRRSTPSRMWLRWWPRHRWSESFGFARAAECGASRRASTRPRMPSLEHAMKVTNLGVHLFLSYVLFPATAYIAVIVTADRDEWHGFAGFIYTATFSRKRNKEKGQESRMFRPARRGRYWGKLSSGRQKP